MIKNIFPFYTNRLHIANIFILFGFLFSTSSFAKSVITSTFKKHDETKTTTTNRDTLGNALIKFHKVGANGQNHTLTNLPVAYCIPSSTNTGDYISNFTTSGGIANISNNSGGISGTGYGDFYNSQTVSQYAGNLLSFSETYVGGFNGFSIWIDWNNDTTFDTSERVFLSSATAAGHSGSFTIPLGQATGSYRMRIRARWGNNDVDPCASISYGEAKDYKLQVLTLPSCSGTPLAGTVSTTPAGGNAGSSYTVVASGYSSGLGLSYQWQYSTNSGGTWTNQGLATSSYSNYTAIAPAIGVITLWRLKVTCTNSGSSANSSNGNFTPSSSQNIPQTGSSSVACGTNTILYDSGGPTSDYANSSNGYTILNAGLSSTISITGSYATENSWDYVKIFSGSGTGGALVGNYTGNGTINYTGTAGQTLTIQFTSDGSGIREGFNLSVTYSGICFPSCSGTPTGGITTASPSSGNPGSSYTVSATGYTAANGLTFQWQYSTNSGSTWTEQGLATASYSNYTAIAPAIGVITLWRLKVTCTNSGSSANSSNGNFTPSSSQNIPQTGSSSVACGTNTILYDSGGPAGDYANSSSGYTILNAGLSSTISITGSYATENSWDYVKIFSGSGTGGALVGNYTGTGTINYTGTAGQTLTIQFTSDASGIREGFNLTVTYSGVCFPSCSGTPTGGTVTTSPSIAEVGSLYTVAATGQTLATNMTYQWQYSTNGGTTWINAGSSSSTYSNYSATAPALGITVLWHLNVTCTNSSLSATSTNGTFTSVSSQIIPATGNNSVICGTNTILYDNGGSAGNYANGSNGYTVLQAGLSSIISIVGSYETESVDYIRIYNGTGITGTLLASYSGTGNFNYNGTAGQTLTVQFYSDGSVTYSGFALNVSYSGVCFPVCAGTPTGGNVSTNPNSNWPGSLYIVSASGQTLATNMIYQWQYSINNGVTWINAGAPSSTYLNYSATAPSSGIVLWQLKVICSNSSQSATSNSGTFTTMFVNDVATGCPNIVSGGLGLNGTDPNPVSCIASSTCVDLEATFFDLGNTTSYYVEPITYNPPINFNGLANPVSVNIDDKWSPTITLPFNFCFYGNSYNQCLVGSNGVLTFDTTNNTPSGTCNWNLIGSNAVNLPVTNNGTLVKNAIFGVFQDINPSVSGEVGWELVALPSGCRALVASWYNVPMYSNNSLLYTGMMVLYENSNIIEVYIKDKKIDINGSYPFNDGNAVVGLHNANGTLATVPPGRNVLDTDWTASNEAWRFVPNGNSIASIKWYEGSGTVGQVVGTTATINVCPSTTTTYTAEITYTLCNGATIKETDTTTVGVDGFKTWNGSVSTNWNSSANWTPTGIPSETDCVLIPPTANSPVISGTNYNALAGSLKINTNGALTLNANNNITITEGIIVQPTGNFIVNNNSNLVQINNTTNTGNITYKRDANIRKLDYVYWSTPVANQNINTLFAPIVAGPKYVWNPTIINANGGQGNWVSLPSSIMTTGKGYIIRGPSASPFNNTTPNNLTATFIGVPNNGAYTVPIYRGTDTNTAPHVGTNGVEITRFSDNWNLLGNPYPSSIKGSQFLFDNNTKIEGNIRLWKHGVLPSTAIPNPFYGSFTYNYSAADYLDYNFTGTNCCPAAGSDLFIGAGQSFFVLMKDGAAASDQVIFNNTLRSAIYPNNNFYRFQNVTNNDEGIDIASLERNRYWLDLVAADNSSNRILVGYIEGATMESDSFYDCFIENTGDMLIYSLINNDKFSIQGRALPFDDNDSVPIGMFAPTAGSYSLAIAAVDGLFEEQSIYLKDNLLNSVNDLKAGPYHFTSSSGVHNSRFEIVYRNNYLNNDDFHLNENIKVMVNNQVSIESNVVMQEVLVYNVLGQILDRYSNIVDTKLILTTLQQTQKTLLLKIKLDNGKTYTKKVLF